MLKLNIGCGNKIKNKEEGWINIDAKPFDGVDIVMDVSSGIIGFEEGTVDCVLLQDVLEHLCHDKHRLFLISCRAYLGFFQRPRANRAPRCERYHRL